MISYCQIYRKEKGFTKLYQYFRFEENFDLVTVIKSAGFYRFAKHTDYSSDFVPPNSLMKSKIFCSLQGQNSKLMSLFWPLIRQLAEIEAMATSKKLITREEWEKKLNDVKIQKEDMNKLVMNFLVTEGYVDAAEKFRMESGTEPDIDLATITDRMAVKKAVQLGNVEDAIEKVNDLNPEILDTNPQLFFHLQQQRLIELIRNGKVEEALEFAQEELAPRGEENQSFLEELERTVALLAFEDVKNSPVGDLLDISQRLKTASEVNAAILTSQSHEKDPKLPGLLRMLLWAQNQLDEKAAYPRITDLFTATLEDPVV
ncbi:hypothetical protein E3N88_41952 [Mikania micrantha]|uniref:CTLH domain-containing protein n=1 Tax=Mikania micrantha TaxID=192012 RepID=A0A5N6LJ77_9ASTR|nr:hypothetical protein E3N88_41952 [Mikania micrantha]